MALVDWKIGVWGRNLSFETFANPHFPIGDVFFVEDFNEIYAVSNYLAENFINYTTLSFTISNTIDYHKIPYGTLIYSKYGREHEKWRHEDAYVLPSKSTVTKEAVSWMRIDEDMSEAICNSLGFRKLTIEEIEALPSDPHLDCFYDDEGKKLTEKKSTVWAFGENLGTYITHLDINKEELAFASKLRNFLFLKNIFEIPKDWIKIHENVIFKKNDDRYIYGGYSCDDLVKSKIFQDYLSSGDFVILACHEYKNETLVQYLNIDNHYFFFNSTTNITEKYKDNLLKSKLGTNFMNFIHSWCKDPLCNILHPELQEEYIEDDYGDDDDFGT